MNRAELDSKYHIEEARADNSEHMRGLQIMIVRHKRNQRGLHITYGRAGVYTEPQPLLQPVINLHDIIRKSKAN